MILIMCQLCTDLVHRQAHLADLLQLKWSLLPDPLAALYTVCREWLTLTCSCQGPTSSPMGGPTTYPCSLSGASHKLHASVSKKHWVFSTCRQHIMYQSGMMESCSTHISDLA